MIYVPVSEVTVVTLNDLVSSEDMAPSETEDRQWSSKVSTSDPELLSG